MTFILHFIKDSQDEILFSSNRLSDTLTNTGDPFEKTALNFDLFTYNLAKGNNVLVRLPEDKYNDRLHATVN